MSDYRKIKSKPKENAAAAAAATTTRKSDDAAAAAAAAGVVVVNNTIQDDSLCLSNMEPFATSSPMNVDRRHNVTYTIRPEEYSIIEDDPMNSNLDEAFSESLQLDESIDRLSSSISSSSSSSESTSYLLEFAQQMIANYPSEEQLSNMIAENYLNYIAELSQRYPLESQDDNNNNNNTNDDSVILLESKGTQTSFLFTEEHEEENHSDEEMQ